MNRADLGRATDLYQQAQEIDRALGVIDEKGTITAVTITPPGDPQWADARTVSTAGLAYPPQMMDAIRTQLEDRLAAIHGELTTLGVTDVPEARR